MAFTPGMRLAERYRLISRIGVGGMSEVWRADDELLDRPVAVKALASSLAADPELRSGTRREATAAARLTHPHITQVYDYGEVNVAGGPPVPYLVMELVVGQNLADMLSRGPLPWREAVRVAAQVAAGLAAAHRLGVVHCDIKPGNVMLTATGAKILDFGIAKMAGTAPETETGPLIGTPAYAAPERLRGAAGAASDVYALGALLYEALTGRKAVAVGSWVEAADVHRRGLRPEPLQVPGLPGDITALCLACLAPDPAQRPSMEEVAARLGAAGTPDTAPRPTVRAVTAHPPTLIDRSLATPANQPANAKRISASAPVVHRPPAFEPDEEQSRPPGRSRVAVLAAGGTVVAAGLAIALALAGSSDSVADNASSTPSPHMTGTQSQEPVAPPSTQPPPATPEDTADALDQLLDEAVASGLMNRKVADDLRDELKDIRKELGKRRVNPRKVAKKVDDLREKLREYVEENRISRDFADRFELLLGSLVLDIGPDHRDDDDD